MLPCPATDRCTARVAGAALIQSPRFTRPNSLAFDKFPDADDALGTQMKSVGETMAIGRTFAEAVQKAGYQTTSPNFRTIVNQTLLKKKHFKRVERGQYTSV